MSDIAHDVHLPLDFLPVHALGGELSERTAIELVAVIRAWIAQLNRRPLHARSSTPT